MNRIRGASLWLAGLMLCGLILPAAWADEGPLENKQPTGITVEEIIQRFAAKEKEFKTARDQYTYHQTVKVQTVDGETVDGEFREDFDVTFDNQGRKAKTVTFAPQSTLQRIFMSQEDFDDIENRLPFVLTSDEIAEYQIVYAGQQQEDELHCYVFDIAPKQVEGKKRYFQGRIWVDDHDFQIVKTYGKTVPDINVKKRKGNENLFPKFTTWREQVDGKYWFPTYTKADDTLRFSTGDVRIKEFVKYEGYKRFGSNAKITFDGKEVPKGDEKDQPQKPQ